MMQMVQMMKELFPDSDNSTDSNPLSMFSGLFGSDGMDMSQIFEVLLFVLGIIGIPACFAFIGIIIEHKHDVENKLIEKGIYSKEKHNKTSDTFNFKNIFISKFFETISTLIIVFFVYLFFELFNVSDTIKDFFSNLF